MAQTCACGRKQKELDAAHKAMGSDACSLSQYRRAEGLRRVSVHASQASRMEAAHLAMGSDVCPAHSNTYGERRRRVRAHASMGERDAAHNANDNYTVYTCCTSDNPEDTSEKRNELQIQNSTCTQYGSTKTAAPYFCSSRHRHRFLTPELDTQTCRKRGGSDCQGPNNCDNLL